MKKYVIEKVDNDPFRVQFFLNNKRGECMMELNKILPENLLINAIWVRVGSAEEQYADKMKDLSRTDAITTSGFNSYRMYNC